MESRELNDEDVDDAMIRMNDPLLEASIPEDEASIFATIRHNDIGRLRNWLQSGNDINFRHTGLKYELKCPTWAHMVRTKSYALLHIAVLHSSSKLIQCLLEEGADVNIQDLNHRTAVHFAVLAGRVQVIKLLLQHGADINIQSYSGRSPLLEAAINGHDECSRFLIGTGADLDLTDTKGTSLLSHLSMTPIPKLDLIHLILQKGANVNITNTAGATPLMFAASMKNLKLVKLLVECGADINKGDRQGRTAVQFLEMKGKLDILLYFIHHGANINIKDKLGISLLNQAVFNMSIPAITVLLLAECQRDASQLLQQDQIVQLCSDHPRFKHWLANELCTPKSLLRFCRQTVRQRLPHGKLMEVCSLDLPRQLQDYLLVRDLNLEDLIQIPR